MSATCQADKAGGIGKMGSYLGKALALAMGDIDDA